MKSILWLVVGMLFVILLVLYDGILGIFRLPIVAAAAISLFFAVKSLVENTIARASESNRQKKLVQILVTSLIFLTLVGVVLQVIAKWRKP
jgi:NADH:ubiquinone oxidoreductase subunit 6 (subunit J)